MPSPRRRADPPGGALLLLRRRWAWAPAAVAVLATVLLVAVVALAVAATARGVVADAGLRATLADAPAPGRAQQVSVRLSSGAAEAADQDRRVRAALAEVLGPALPGGPAAVTASAAAGPLAVAGTAVRVDALVAPDLPRHAQLVAGGWPDSGQDGPGQDDDGVRRATLHEAAAAALGVEPGDRLRVDPGEPGTRPVDVVVTGTWVPRDPDDPWFLGTPVEVTGVDRPAEGAGAAVVGPLAFTTADPVDPAAAAGALPLRWTVRWRAAVDVASVGADDAAGVRARLAGLPGLLDDVPRAGSAAPQVSEGLGAALAAAAGPVAATRAALSGLVVLLAALVGVALALAAALVAQARAGEALLLRARGASRTGRLGLTAVETALLAAATVAPAALLAATVVRAVAAGDPGRPGAAGLLAAAAALVLVAALLAAAVLALAVDRALAGVRLPGRAAAARDAGALLAVAAAGGLAAWQLGTVDDEGDPVLALAPAALLLAASVLAVRALRVVLAPAAVLARRPGAVPALTGWRLARSAARPATPVVAVVLAAASVVVLAASVAGLSATAQDRGRRAVGAAYAVDARPADVLAVPAALGTGPASPVAVVRTTLGGEPVRLVGVDAASVAAATAAAGAGGVAPGTARALAEPAAGRAAARPVLPPGRRLTLTVRAAPWGPDGAVRLPAQDDGPLRDDVPTRLTVVVAGGSGASLALPLPDVPADGAPHDVAVDLPTDLVPDLPADRRGAALRLAAVDVTTVYLGLPPGLPPTPDLAPWTAVDRSRVEVLAADVDGAAVAPPAGWGAQAAGPVVAGAVATAGPQADGALVRVDVAGGQDATGRSLSVRLLPGGPDARVATVPAVVDRALASRLGVGAGDRLTAGTTGAPVRLLVTRVVDRLPTASAVGPGSADDGTPAVLVDVTALDLARTAPGTTPAAVQRWWSATAPVAGDGPPLAVTTLADKVDRLQEAPLLRQRARLLTLAAAVGGLLLVAAPLLADAVAARARRREVVVLRLLGLSGPQVRRLLVAEQVGVQAAALAAGLLVGAAVVPLAVPVLAADGGDVVVVRPWTAPLAVAAAALAVVTVVVVLRSRQAARADVAGLLRGEAG